MNETMHDASGVVDLPSARPVAETAQRLADTLEAHGMTVFARIDQQKAARDAGIVMRPMVLIIFGNPAGGTPLMIAYPTLAIDLPLKALVWEDADGRVLVSYNSPAYLQQRHGLPMTPFGNLASLLELAVS
jgi:uncharacterized protein (DUF302 family)